MMRHKNILADFCNGTGSLHQIGLDMFHFSSPVGSPSHIKLKHVLDATSHFYISPAVEIFAQTRASIAKMLEGYGLHQTKSSNKNTSVIDMFAQSKSGCRHQARIYIQSEQHISGAFKRVRSELNICSDSQNCIIWEFSDNNYMNLRTGQELTVLTPIMIQSPSCLSPYESLFPKNLTERSFDIVFFGTMTDRRKDLLNQSESYIVGHPKRIIINQISDKQTVANF